MNSAIWSDIFSSAACLAIQSSLLILIGLGANSLARRREAALRSFIGRAALAGGIIFPIVWLLAGALKVPRLPAPIPPPLTRAVASFQTKVFTGVPTAIDTDHAASEPATRIAPTHAAAVTRSMPQANTATGTQDVSPARPALGAHRRVDWIAVVVAAWAVMALFLFGRILAGFVGLTLLVRQAESVDEPACIALSRKLSAALSVRPPRLLTSHSARNPYLAGLWRCAIVLPASFAADFSQTDKEAILAHELAHLARRDAVWKAVAAVACSLFWFQPLLWVLAAQLDQVSEEACDDLVLHLGVSTSNYAGCLVSLAERILPGAPLPAGAMGILPSRTSLGRRVSHIVNGAPKPVTLSTWTRAAGALVLVLVLLTGSVTFASRALSAVGKPLDIDTSAFSWAKQQGWDVQPISLVTEQGNANLSRIPSDLTSQDAELVHACNNLPGATSQATWSVPSVENDPFARRSLAAFVAAHPHFFYAEYLLADWYLSHDDRTDYRTWHDRAVADAPAFLAGRIQYKDGRPLAGYTIAIALQCGNSGDPSHPITATLNYPFVTTDSEGCYYVPVYHGGLNVTSEADHNVSDPPFKTLDQLVGPKLAGTVMLSPSVVDILNVSMAQYDQRMTFDGRVGILPPRFIEPDIELNAPFTNRFPVWYKAMAVHGTKLTVSWNPYPGAVGYNVGLQVQNQGSHPSVFRRYVYQGQARWVPASDGTDIATKGTSYTFDLSKRVSSKPLYISSLSARAPVSFHRGWVYSIGVSCYGGNQRWLASSKNYTFQLPDAANP